MNRYRNIALLLCAAILPGCGDSAVQDITGPFPSASIKFFNFGVGAPDVNFYANDTKLTAINSSSGVESPLGTGRAHAGCRKRFPGFRLRSRALLQCTLGFVIC